MSNYEADLPRHGSYAAVADSPPAHHCEAPDIETSSDAYAQRFRGRLGAWFLDVQKEAVLRLLRLTRGGRLPETVLELGGGHGQLAGVLAAEGVRVDVQGSAPVCAARLSPILDAYPDQVRFQVAALDELPYKDKSYDAVIGVRLMAHVDDWRNLLKQMACVACHTILIDFAPSDGIHILANAGFGLKLITEQRTTRPYFSQSLQEVRAELTRLGFTRITWERQFVWPMAAHRLLGWVGLSRLAERAAKLFHLDKINGGPVLICATRPETLEKINVESAP